MKRKYILLLLISIVLASGCSKSSDVDKDLSIEKSKSEEVPKNYEEALKYYHDKLEDKKEVDTYIKLADLHREHYKYDDEGAILLEGIEELGKDKNLVIRYSNFQRAIKGEDFKDLQAILDKGYDEEAFRELLKAYLESDIELDIPKLYREFKDSIKKSQTNILVYRAIDKESDLGLELKKNLINSQDLEAYELMIEEAFQNEDMEEARDLIDILKSIPDGQNLINVYGEILEMDMDSLMALKLGNFTDKEKKDLAVFYEVEKAEDKEFYLKLIGGENGEILSDELLEDSYPDFVQLNLFQVPDKLDRLTSVEYYGLSATSGKDLKIYEYKEDGFKEVDHELKNDIRIKMLDDFQVEIASENLNRKYIIDIPMEYWKDYVEDQQYQMDGGALTRECNYIYGDGYFFRDKSERKDTVGSITGFGGTASFAADRLGYIEEFYNEVGGKLKLTHFKVKGLGNFHVETEYVDGVYVSKLKETASSGNSIEKEDIENETKEDQEVEKKQDKKAKEKPVESKGVKTYEETIKELKYLLGLQKKDIRKLYGQPEEIGEHSGGEYWDYGNRRIFFEFPFDDADQAETEGITSIGLYDLRDIFGIEGKLTRENVKNTFKAPKFEGTDDYFQSYTLVYIIENLEFYFIALNESGESLLVKRAN